MNIWESISNSLKARKGEFTGTSGNEDKISKKVSKGQSVNIANPTSQRTFHRDADSGSFIGQQIDIGDTTMDVDGELGEVVSSAISNFEYDPKTGLANITFVGGDKPYEYKMTPAEVDQFINSDSKGRFVAQNMNYNPHYRSPNY